MQILITGPESTGKTTIANRLNLELGVNLLPEYARIYLTKYGPDYAYDDIAIMAKDHHTYYQALNHEEAIVLDTYMLNYQIWSEYKYGKCDAWILKQVKEMKMDYIFLLYPDTPWTADPLRESKGERKAIFELYERELTRLEFDFHIIKGEGEQRYNEVIERIKGS